MSYELEKQGVDTNNKLWTATALTDQLSKVYQAHWDWLIFIKMAGSPTAGVEYLQQC
ncbi:hypothetical protein [Lactobacillus crispatus]|uniref:hypothetical protein n=1 Tax=Lactobacillus crispatus TaxID=47770 RepID=UPI0021B50042|nr:hypothetical protein [Lactobacillus crispatus]